MSKRIPFSNISVIFAVFLALISVNPWFVWGHSHVGRALILGFILCRTCLTTVKVHKSQLLPLLLCIILCLYLYFLHAATISDMFSTIITRMLPLLLFLLFSNTEKANFIKWLTNLFSTISIVSLVFFLLWHLGFSLGYSTLNHADGFYNSFYNYYFFIISGDLGLFTRFQSVFTEPGHLGFVSALLLYINKYDLKKWQVWSLIISLLWSLSLAAYVLLIAGFVIYIWSTSKNTTKVIFRLTAALFACIFIVNIYYQDNRDSVFSQLIIERLQLNSDGSLAGDNRNTKDFMQYYNEFTTTLNSIVGLGAKEYSMLQFNGGNSSYRCFVLEYGYLGLVLLMLFGMSNIRPGNSKQYWGLFFLYCLSFIQRPYALWEIESFPFIAFSCNFVENIKYE